jgi:hypothetical protein
MLKTKQVCQPYKLLCVNFSFIPFFTAILHADTSTPALKQSFYVLMQQEYTLTF